MVLSSSLAPETIKRWQKRASILAAIAAFISICGFVFPLVFKMLTADRDREIAMLRTSIVEQSREIKELKRIMRDSVDATRVRFSQNEKNVQYLREAVVAMRTEMDIRFGKHQPAPTIINSRIDTDTVQNAGSKKINMTSREQALKRLANRANKQLKQSDKSAPQGDPFSGISLYN